MADVAAAARHAYGLAGLFVFFRGRGLLFNPHVVELAGVEHFSADFALYELGIFLAGNDPHPGVFARGGHGPLTEELYCGLG